MHLGGKNINFCFGGGYFCVKFTPLYENIHVPVHSAIELHALGIIPIESTLERFIAGPQRSRSIKFPSTAKLALINGAILENHDARSTQFVSHKIAFVVDTVAVDNTSVPLS